MSGMRLYLHDRHGRQISGDLRVQRAARDRRCDGYRHDGDIRKGDYYGISTLYPSNSDFNYLDRDTLKPSQSAARWHLCTECLSDDERELIAALEVGSNVRASTPKEATS